MVVHWPEVDDKFLCTNIKTREDKAINCWGRCPAPAITRTLAGRPCGARTAPGPCPYGYRDHNSNKSFPCVSKMKRFFTLMMYRTFQPWPQMVPFVRMKIQYFSRGWIMYVPSHWILSKNDPNLEIHITILKLFVKQFFFYILHHSTEHARSLLFAYQNIHVK